MGGRSPRMPRRVDSLTTDDVISFTFTNHDDMEDRDMDNAFANRRFRIFERFKLFWY